MNQKVKLTETKASLKERIETLHKLSEKPGLSMKQLNYLTGAIKQAQFRIDAYNKKRA